jgi:hyperosmotically inducible periplasmic protein
MRRLVFAVLAFATIAAGCDELNTQNAKIPDRASPDNSQVNERDRSGEMKTPLDQGQSSADIERTAEIRRRILEIPDVSVNGQNVKVITANGNVTLRGPVASDAEKEAIYRAAVDVAGEDNVMNELQVPTPKT